MWDISTSSIWCVIFPVPFEERILSRCPTLLILCCACSSCSLSHHQQGFYLCLLLPKKKQSKHWTAAKSLCCGWWLGNGDPHSLCYCRPCWSLCIYWSWIVQYCHNFTMRFVFSGALELTFVLYLLQDLPAYWGNFPWVNTIRAEVKTELKQPEIIGFLSQLFLISFLFLQWRKINRFLPWNSSVW